MQVIKHREGGHVIGVTIKVVYGDPEEVLAEVGGHTAYVERTHLTSRQMNGRLVRKTLYVMCNFFSDADQSVEVKRASAELEI